MMTARFALSSLAVLALAACAPASEDKGERESAPIGYELAVAKQEAPERRFVAGPLDFTNDQSEVIDLTPEQLSNKLKAGDIFLIDVRTDEEVAAGMIPGAIHIALDKFSPSPALEEQAGGREIVVYCRSGRRSAIAARNLSGYLGKPVEHLAGGILAWQEAGEPTQ